MSLFSLSGSLEAAHRRFVGSQRAPRQRQRHRRPSFVPQPETLETRTALSGGYVFSTLDDPSAGKTGSIYEVQGTFAYMINNCGQITGWYVDAEGATHGFLLSHGQYTTLDDPAGMGSTFADGINDRGQIVGFYFDSTGLAHGFLATPKHRS